MNDADRLKEIADLEAWFRDVCGPVEPVERDAIRRRVALAAEEVWLASQMSEVSAGDVAERAKARVREELHRERRRTRHPVLKLSWWLGGGLGVAAAIALSVMNLRTTSAPKADEPLLSLVLAFEQFDEDGFDAELAQLREALSSADEPLDVEADWVDWTEGAEEASHDGI